MLLLHSSVVAVGVGFFGPMWTVVVMLATSMRHCRLQLRGAPAPSDLNSTLGIRRLAGPNCCGVGSESSRGRRGGPLGRANRSAIEVPGLFRSCSGLPGETQPTEQSLLGPLQLPGSGWIRVKYFRHVPPVFHKVQSKSRFFAALS